MAPVDCASSEASALPRKEWQRDSPPVDPHRDGARDVWAAVAPLVGVSPPDRAVSPYPLASFCASSEGVAAVTGSYATPG